jgi:NDP-sugar pyrophosphorylase family protein
VGCLVADWALPRLSAGETIHSVPLDGPWTDAGDLPSYLEANRDWLRALDLSQYVAPGAVVAPGISLERSVVGADARIVGSGVLEDCVVWPGAYARAPLSHRIVMSNGRQVPVPA